MSDLSKAYHDLAMGQCDLATATPIKAKRGKYGAIKTECNGQFPYPERHGAAVNILAGVH